MFYCHIRKRRLRDGILVSGSAGSGKTTYLLNLIDQLREQEIYTLYIDPKSDLAHGVRYGIDSFPGHKIKLNPLCPPGPRVDLCQFRNLSAKLFCEQFQFFQRGFSIFLLGMDFLYRKFDVYRRWPNWDWKTMDFPTLHDLLDVFQSYEFARGLMGKGKESLYSIVDKQESLQAQLGPIVRCQRGFDIAQFHAEKRMVSYCIEGLDPEAQNFLTLTLLLSHSIYFQTYGPRGGLNMVFIVDEAGSLLDVRNRNNTFMMDVFPKFRERGVAMVCADQTPSRISQYYFSNIASLIMFRHSDGVDLRKIEHSAGLTGYATVFL